MLTDRQVIQTRLVLPGDTNAHNTLFGGKLLSYIDDVSAIAAVKYSQRIVVTASTDSVDFRHPIAANDSVTLTAFVSGVGTRSIEVFCRVMGETLTTGKTYLATTAFSTYVVVDGQTTPLPSFTPVTAEEQLLFSGYPERRTARKVRRDRNRAFISRLEATEEDRNR
ncbi:acyl-CoA thioesterase [Lacticaseibacillus casei]|uniref:HotDog ACOT-type domain-containing protein n=1 Tax=Lacticaseibacillus casei TaxID=1582 RepID=A0AAN1F0D9_LACCA|nr:hypothetical protein BGL52_12170 [Lacticaseibacillus casei]KAB1968227.1 acyl-CoA thioesterase [Lacticaseibacillus casei]